MQLAILSPTGFVFVGGFFSILGFFEETEIAKGCLLNSTPFQQAATTLSTFFHKHCMEQIYVYVTVYHVFISSNLLLLIIFQYY